jgi:hypothetical protein
MKMKLFVERGQALILIALAAVGLFAVTGLAIDGSAKFSDRRHAQNAADTAALAAALAKSNALENPSLSSTPVECPASSPPYSDVCNALLDAGLNRADSNGYDDNLVSNTVEVYSPPISGAYAGDDSYVQVIITSYVDTYFARVIGINQTRNIVEAVALAKKGGPLGDGAMIVAYDPDPNCSSGGGSGGGSVDVSGNGTVNLYGGGIFVNSDESCGFSIPNCADLNIYSGGINSAASVDNIDQDGCSTTATENLGQDPVIIPDDVDIPDEPSECTQLATAYKTGANEWHITPGYYSDFPQANINGNIIPANKQDIIMDPGIYCVGQDIKWSGQTFTSLDGSSGVTLYLRSGADFDLNINSPITLYAPDSGSEYDGYIIIQDGTPTSIGSCHVAGGSYLNIEGTVFAPYCDITVNGGNDSNAQINAQLVGWNIKLNGNNTINFNYDPSKIPSVNRKIGLMR